MPDKDELFEKLMQVVLACGAAKATVIPAAKIECDTVFRDICSSNACGLYGKCWMCPPDIGDITRLMDEVRGYAYALVYQTVSDIEDSFDIEGMLDARKQFHEIEKRVRRGLDAYTFAKVLHLGAGGCGVCETCSKVNDEPCRYPELAISSLEAYGIHVSKLATASDMRYINGENTVTYFGAVLFTV
ncbi:MAG: DUF2284 domain-containing protein [Clostridia bacterium]|nr:DUF2284 domain-containing protein [Clostridia bacterium]